MMQGYTPLLHTQKKRNELSISAQILGSALFFIFATWLAINTLVKIDARQQELETKTGYVGGSDGGVDEVEMMGCFVKFTAPSSQKLWGRITTTNPSLKMYTASLNTKCFLTLQGCDATSCDFAITKQHEPTERPQEFQSCDQLLGQPGKLVFDIDPNTFQDCVSSRTAPGKAAEKGKRHENWMSNLDESIKTTKAVWELKIPYTHDTMTYDVTEMAMCPPADAVQLPAGRAAVTQDATLIQQLNMGVRGFDFRVASYDVPVREDGELCASGVMVGHSDHATMHCLEDIRSKLTTWLSDHPNEILVVNMQLEKKKVSNREVVDKLHCTGTQQFEDALDKQKFYAEIKEWLKYAVPYPAAETGRIEVQVPNESGNQLFQSTVSCDANSTPKCGSLQWVLNQERTVGEQTIKPRILLTSQIISKSSGIAALAGGNVDRVISPFLWPRWGSYPNAMNPTEIRSFLKECIGNKVLLEGGSPGTKLLKKCKDWDYPLNGRGFFESKYTITANSLRKELNTESVYRFDFDAFSSKGIAITNHFEENLNTIDGLQDIPVERKIISALNLVELDFVGSKKDVVDAIIGAN